MILREYQKEAKEEIRIAFSKHKRVVCCSPTGAGKTVIASSIINDSFKKDKNICIVVHRIEILKQFYKALHEFGLTWINFIVAKQTEYQLAREGFQGMFKPRLQRLNLCMVETFHRRYGKGYGNLNVDFYILDEIHHGSYRKLCHQSNKSFILGFTATPKASNKDEPLNGYFDDIVCPVSVNDLIELGYLVRGKTFSIKHNFKNLKMRMGEFTERSLYEEFHKPKLFKGVVDNYLRNANNLRAICYSVNVRHSKETCKEFKKAGVPSEHVDGTTDPKTRADIFARYEQGNTQILCNVGVATTGYDNPSTRCIIENCATAQLTKHHQMLGRGSRPLTNPLADPKEEFIIIDMGKNYLRHGLYGEQIDWKEVFNDPNQGTNAKETKRRIECKNCGAVIKVNTIKCPYCNNERSLEDVNKTIQGFMSAEEIKDYKLSTLPAYLRGKKFSEMSDTELKQYGDLMGYKPSWFWVIRNKLGRR
jgi:superfamily II DNA or RNA helicase